jgi:hypothetical protein
LNATALTKRLQTKLRPARNLKQSQHCEVKRGLGAAQGRRRPEQMHGITHRLFAGKFDPTRDTGDDRVAVTPGKLELMFFICSLAAVTLLPRSSHIPNLGRS